MIPTPVTLTTPRLLLRPWQAADREPFAALNGDPEVMRHFPACLDRAASDAMIDRCQQGFAERGWGLWAVQIRQAGEFVGLLGLHPVRADLPFAPAVEIGWRFARAFWGAGLASEGARAALAYGFQQLGLAEIVAFTTPCNQRSQAVMHRLGMQPDGAFDHPQVSPGHALRRHLLFRLRRVRWSADT